MSVEMNDDILEGVPEHIKEKLLDLSKQIDLVESVVNKIDSTSINELQQNLTPLDISKLNWLSIYAINSLFFVYLKNNGVPLKDHALMTELGRVRSYMSRITDIEKAEENKIKNTNRIDKQSSARIIKRSLWMQAQKQTAASKNEPENESEPESKKRIKTDN